MTGAPRRPRCYAGLSPRAVSGRGPHRAFSERGGVERGCIAGRMQPESHHGLLTPGGGRFRLPVLCIPETIAGWNALWWARFPDTPTPARV